LDIPFSGLGNLFSLGDLNVVNSNSSSQSLPLKYDVKSYRSYAEVVKAGLNDVVKTPINLEHIFINSHFPQSSLIEERTDFRKYTFEKFVNKLISKTTCTCTVNINKLCKVPGNKNFKYISKNIREILPKLDVHYDIGMHYAEVVIHKPYNQTEQNEIHEPDDEFCRDFLDMAMCSFHEQSFVEFFNIISQAWCSNKVPISEIKDLIFPHLSCVSLSSLEIKKYNINIDMSNIGDDSYTILHKSFVIYDNTITQNNKIKKANTDGLRKVKKYTDYERFVSFKNEQYLNISLVQWLSDLLTVAEPMKKWISIWKKR
jgi:hypothetical protein